MCGVAGLYSRKMSGADIATQLTAMCRRLEHRGPDDEGVWVDPAAQLGLAHRRLSILDLSQRGHQPMTSPSGRYVISYNGEIYNYLDLKRELEATGAAFQGGSDTEVLLAAIDAWGLAPAVKRLNGIFAFGLWDREKRALHLVRDHLGVKPLCYGWLKGTLLWGSDVRIFRTHPDFQNQISQEALSLYFQFGFVPAPLTIYEGCRKVGPGAIVSFSFGDGDDVRQEENAYWSASIAALAAPAFAGDEAAATDALAALLADAVKRQMVSDVSLGAFLSGGVDSSLVTALMQAASAKPVKSFSIGFEEAAYDESGHAERVARHLGTEHTTFRVTAKEALSVIPLLPQIFDEPFADSSAVPTYLLSRLTRGHVTVSLSGDGGDELFGGYNRYRQAARIESLARAPRPLLKAAGSLLRSGSRVGKALDFAREKTPVDRYLRLLSLWAPGAPPLSPRGAEVRHRPLAWQARLSPTENMMLTDAAFYLPDDILCKVDRASMAVGLEARVPLLDPRVFEFAWTLKADWKFDARGGKKILKSVLNRRVPAALVERPKMGFGVPVESWLKGPLRDWAENLLSEKSLADAGGLDSRMIRQRWAEHLAGTGQWQAQLWAVLMFVGWRRGAAPRP